MTATDTIRVLVVDDSWEILRHVTAILSPACQVVGAVTDGPSALESVQTLHPDVVVLDISMPGMNGFEVAGRLHRTHAEVRIVFLTIHDDEELVRAAEEAGGMGYVTKNTLQSDLVTAVNEVSAGRRYVALR